MAVSAHANEYMRLRNIARVYFRAGLSIPTEIQVAIDQRGAALNFDLGTPTETAYCAECARTVGGPYFNRSEALARLKEHRHNLHEVGRQPFVPNRAQLLGERAMPNRPRLRGSFVE